MGVRWGSENGEGQVTPRSVTVLIGMAIGIAAALLVDVVVDDDEPAPARADIEAQVVVDAAVIEMHGYGSDGKPGVFLYDCRHVKDEDKAKGEPTLVCEQRMGG